ncbi:MAG: DUF1501 domain-containing protein [Acidobacteria bacterium]|nr:DUF1501 domain-containing protein [Acidobacteriota bacterium]
MHIRQLITRRDCFTRMGAGLAGIAAGSLLARETHFDVRPRQPHFAARAKRVIFLFQNGGPSQVDLFDPKPELIKRHGQKPGEGYVNTVDIKKTGMWQGSPFKFARHGRSGAELSEVLPGLARHADDIAIIRSMVTTHSNHEQAIWNFNTGSIQPGRPSLGSWVTYGLGTENQNLPAFVAIMNPKGLPVDGVRNFSNGWMAPVFNGFPVRAEGTPVIDLKPAGPEGAAAERLDLVRKLNQEHLLAHPGDLELEARIQSFELAARMQVAAAEAMDLSREPAPMHALYGTEDAEAGVHARQLLLARRLIERGVRFVQVLHNGQPWDTHRNNEKGHREIARRTDGPTAALLEDLRARGLMEDTLVIWSGEFGRTPMTEGNDGRDHHKFSFSMWMAGAGVKAGVTHGATDEFGYHSTENIVSIPDFHATVMHLLGLDANRLAYQNGPREEKLTDVHPARVVREILA